MADNVFRRSLAAGAAAASVGAIVLSSVAMLPEDEIVVAAPRVVAAEFEPTASADYLEILTAGVVGALEQSADGLFRKSPELWNTVVETWPDADLTHLNYARVADIFLAPVAPLVIGPINDAVAEVLAQQFPTLGDEIRALPDLVEYSVVRVIGPVLSAIGGAGQAHSEIFYSMTTGELEPFFTAVARAPFHVVDGFLNGGYGDLGPVLPGREGSYIPAPGILTPWGEEPAPRDIKTPEDVEDATTTESALSRITPVGVVENLSEQLVTGSAELTGAAAEPTAAADEQTEPTEPADDASAPDPATKPARGSARDTSAVTAEEAKPKRRTSITQGVKDFRAGVRDAAEKLTGTKKVTEASKPDATKSDAAKSDAAKGGTSSAAADSDADD